MTGILMLESLTRGNTLKQGDKTPLTYELLDADGDNLNIAGKTATVRLVYPNYLTIGYEKSGLLVSQDDTVTFTIDNVIPARKYNVEIIVDDKFVFPSRSVESKFTIDKSTLGTEASIIEIVGKDVLISEVKSQLDTELQPLVTSLESSQQAEEQRKADHANRSAEFDGKADKVVLKNLIENGDFSDGLNGWHYRNLDAEIVDGKVKATITVTDVAPSTSYFGKSGVNFYKDHEYYFRFEIEPTKESGTVALINGQFTKNVIFPANKLSVYSAISVSNSTKVSSSSDLRINHKPNAGYVIGDTYTIDNVMLIDLTETFGAGNKPTKEQMDELIEFTGYIDGEYALNNKEMLGHLMKGIRDNVNESVKDYLNEFPIVKSKTEEALTKSQNALNVTNEIDAKATEALNTANGIDVKATEALTTANGIDAKATEALNTSTDADALSKSVQSQFNQVVIDGDSSVESAQARVDVSGHTNATLKERLDKEHNEVITQLAQTSLKKANQIGIDVTNPPNGLTPAKANGVTDDTLAINNILLYAEAQGIKNVFIPEGNYRITDTINLFRELQLTLAHNAVIRFVSLTNNIFKMATRSVLKGGKILTRYDFKGSVFYYRGVVSNSTIDGIKCYGTNFKGTDFRDINTGTIVHFDGYYPTETELGVFDSYAQYNTFKNVYAQWYGTFLKAEVNLDRPGQRPWFTANLFLNIEVERVNRIVDMNVGGANFFDHIRVQCGPQDDLLFSLRGKCDLNRFTNIFYYDIVAQTQIVEMDTSTTHNYFELWYDGTEYRAKTINRGYRNRIEAPGAMLEVPKEIPLTAEWVKLPGAYPEARVFKTKEGIVHIEGAVTNLTKTNGEPFNGLIGVLPVGYRPRETMIYTVASGGHEQTNVWINHSNGEIRAYANVDQIYLSGIAPYRAAR